MILIHVILSQQGQQEIFSLKAGVFHWSFLKKYFQLLNEGNNSRVWKFREIYNYNMSYLHQLKSTEVCGGSYSHRGVFERIGFMLFLNRCVILLDGFDGVFWWKRVQLFL